MTNYVAFLRAVNVGGTGKLSMHDLRKMCIELGLAHVQTYIASGNVVFTKVGMPYEKCSLASLAVPQWFAK